MTLDQSQWMTLTFDIHIHIGSNNFDIIDYNIFWHIHCFTFFPYKSIRDQRTSYALADFVPTIDLDEIYVQDI